MSNVTILAVLRNHRLAGHLRTYLEAQRPHFRPVVVATPGEALDELGGRRFDSVWYECDEHATGLSEVAMVFAPHEVIALVGDQGVASISLDKGASAVAFLGDQGSPWPVCARLTEVALGREAQLRALQLTEQRFEAAIRGAHLGLWHWSVAHRQLVLDERWRRQLGYLSADEIKTGDTPWLSLIPEQHAERTREAIHRCLMGSTEFFSTELTLTGPNGQERPVLIAGGVSHSTRRGEPIQMAGVLLDLAQRGEFFQANNRAETSRSEKISLAENGAETLKLAEELIRTARSHLSTILGYGEILLHEESADPTRHEAASAILSSVRTLLRAVTVPHRSFE